MPSPGVHLLGRVQPPNQRHAELHPFRAITPQTVEVEIARPTLDQYNQKATPRCVGYSISKVMNHFNRYAFDADWLYLECKKRDGDPTGDGTSARYACDVLRLEGHWRKISGVPVKVGPRRQHGIQGNTWASTVDQIRAVFAAAVPQPVPIGIDWCEAWFNPEEPGKYGEYYLQSPASAGNVVGGHEIGIWACSDERQAFGLSNTWGNDWTGRANQLVWMRYTTMDWLFGRGADACVIQDLATR